MEQPYFRQQSARDALRQAGNRERRHFPYFWAQSLCGAGFAYGSGGTQFAAPVNLSKSDAYSLTVTAPAGLVAGLTRSWFPTASVPPMPTSAYSVTPSMAATISTSAWHGGGIFLSKMGRITLESSITRTTMSSTSPAIPLSLPMPRATGLTMTGQRSRRPST